MDLKRIDSRDNPGPAPAAPGGFFPDFRRKRQHRSRGTAPGPPAEAAQGPVEALVVCESQGTGEMPPTLPVAAPSVFRTVFFRSLGPGDNPSGVLALAPIPESPTALPTAVDCVLPRRRTQDPGNVGTPIRTAAAAGVGHVLLFPDCAGAWLPVLRAGQGRPFCRALYRRSTWNRLSPPTGKRCSHLPGRQRATLGSALETRCLDLRRRRRIGSAPACWSGRNPRAFPWPAAWESLNVAAAAAICLFEMRRQRSRSS